ncbi:MAG: flagellar brake protein [Spirochaeta sp.]
MAQKIGFFTRFKFKKQAHSHGLTDQEAESLLFLAESYQLPLPERLLNDLDFLMTHAERMHMRIRRKKNESASAETYLHNIFEAVRKLQNAKSNEQQGFSSTREFGTGMTVRLRLEKGVISQSIITANTDSAFGVKTPRDHQGNQIRMRKGTKIHVQAVGDEGRLYQFPSTVVGYNKIRGISCMFLNHSSELRMVSKRRAPRRYYEKPVYYYPIIIDEIQDKKGTRKKARVLDARRYLGKIEDISAGGCCIRCRTPLKEGSLLKAEFDTPINEHIQLFGKVVAVRPSRSGGSRMHIQFTRLSRHHLNTIDAFVLGFGEYREGR